LRSALTALTEPGGYYFEETPDGIAVRFRRTVLYAIDYPQLTRSGSGSASITLGGVNNGGGYNQNGQTAIGCRKRWADRQHQVHRRHPGFHFAGEPKHVLDDWRRSCGPC
jgi:hypothetical protein